MGINTGIVTNQEVTTFKGGGPFRVLDVQLLGEFSTKAVYFNVSGDDSAPVDGDEVVIYDLGGGFKVAMKTFDTLTPTAAAGERRLYSRDSAGAVASYIHMKADGSIDINAPAGLNITADTDITGTLTVSGIIKSLVDIIADYAATAITMLTHYHIGNLGRKTTVGQITGGSAMPSPAPSTDSNGDVISGSGTSLDNHDHDYTWTDPAGSGTTDPPN